MSSASASVSVLAASPQAAASAEAEQQPGLELVRLEGVAGEDRIGPLAAGLQRAGGELVLYLAPGDSLLPGAVAKLTAALVARPAAALVYPSFHPLDEHGARLGTTVPEELDFMEMLMFQYSPVGPAPMFRREIGLEVARLGAEPAAVAEFAFWLRIAARGGLRRLVEPLACRQADRSGPARKGVESARDRLALLERLLAEPGFPQGSKEAMRSAARSACVLAAMEFEDGFNSPGERFFVADRFAEAETASAATDFDAEIARLEAEIVNGEQRLARHGAVVPLLESTVSARENRLGGPEGSGRSLRGLARRLRGGGDER